MTLLRNRSSGAEERRAEHASKDAQELISGMEQFMQVPVGRRVGVREPPYYALELAVPADSPELQFYAAVPNGKRNLFENNFSRYFRRAPPTAVRL